MILTTVTGPATEPITLTEAKAHLRVTGTDEDDLITRLIQASREECELVARRALITQTLEGALVAWPGRQIQLLRPPLQSVTSISYTDSDGAAGTVSSDDYIVDIRSTPGRVWLKESASWPSATLQAGPSLVVRYVAGFGDAAANVPAHYRQALLIILGDLYENRERTTMLPGITQVTLDAVNNMLLMDRGSY